MTDDNNSSIDKQPNNPPFQNAGAEDIPPATSKDFRNIGYFVLVFAAIFIINAMETGSYRTPWPIAIAVTGLGAGLLIYAYLRKQRENL